MPDEMAHGIAQPMQVIWFHNNPEDRSGGSFMWDAFDHIQHANGIEIALKSIPVVRSPRQLFAAVKSSRSGVAPDIVHGQYGSLVGLLTAVHPGRRHILSLRGSDIYWRYGTLSQRLGGIARMLMSWIGCLRSDAIVVMSEAMAARVKRWWWVGRRRVHVLVDPAGSLFWPETCRAIAEELYKTPFSILVASLVEINPVKRLSIVAEAVKLCADAGMAVSITMLSGRTRAQVREAIIDADSVALASTHEGWPNIIKEALLLGRPFVATDVSDLAKYAPATERNRIVPPTPLDFAMAWVDQIAVRVLQPFGIAPELAAFHPDVCALKMRMLYLSCAERRP